MVLSHLHRHLLLLLLSLSPLPLTSLPGNFSHGNPLPLTPAPAVAAAGTILKDRPFVVVWNMPTSHCQKRYNVHLNLGDFDIVENRQQRFQGQKMTIFYRDRLGEYPYLSRDGRKVNGGVPQEGDLAAHLSLTAMQMSGLLQPNFAGLAVIDWEEWRPLWERNFGSKMEYRRLSKHLVRQARPDLSERAVTSLARKSFEESAQMFMEETLRSAVRGHPKGLWGFYGFPACFNKHKIKTDKSYTGRCHRGTRQQNERLSWLWSQSTALYPSIYLPQRLAGSQDAALMVRHRLLEALRVASLWRHDNNIHHATPVLPYARLAFTHTLNFLNETDLEHTLGESASLGAAGVVLWGERKFAKSKEQCIFLRDYIHAVLGPFVRSLRSDTHRCSLQLCHGNGRCTRRHPNSGHMVSSGQAVLSDPHDSSSVKAFHRHFMCQCFPGWTGQECGEMMKDDHRPKNGQK
ncbi:hyaluronidase-3 [Hippoglossus hippoglossus]|uniref:hyaluronidase-3 n=1 Tax=Hippoglossus hippoglossus TaxID=8267 RepID=UPI00148C320C|nr:hyaluronidase-3 [Hippoglossus hippoglossus]